jgi:hypothetical protein
MKGVFNCRGSGGGDVIGMVMHITDCSFTEAIEKITGERADHSREREEEQGRADGAKKRRDEQTIKEVRERAIDLDDPRAEHGKAYFVETRCLTPYRNLTRDIQYVEALDYYGCDNGSGELKLLARLPAISAVIRDHEGRATGLQLTYLDPNRPTKWRPICSEHNSAKKIRGDKQHGMIRLGPLSHCLGLGEGWENVLAWRQLGLGPAEISLAAAIDLGNLAGRSTGTIEHPWSRGKDGKPVHISNGEPDLNSPGVIFPDGVEFVIIPSDNDSEPIATIAKYRCAVKRFQAQGIKVALFWPPSGADWNDVLLYQTKGTPLPEDAEATQETRRFRHPGGSETGQEFLARTESIFSTPRQSWPERKPIVAELKPVPAFDANVLLPEALRPWIVDEAERMPCPPDFIAAAAIVALASIIGARCAIKPKSLDSWLVVPNLWGGIVGDPSEKKSPAMTAALKAMDQLIGNAQGEYDAALRSYEADKTVFEAERAALETRIREAARSAKKGDPKMIAKDLQAHRDKAPCEPTARRYKTNDGTAEKLGELLRDNPHGFLVQRDELVGLVATWDREGREGERAFFQEAWNGNQSFDVDRIGRGHIHVPNLCLSVFGGIQPDKLTMYLEQAANSLANDGMLQRFQLLIYPNSPRWEWRNQSPNFKARDTAFSVFERLSDLDPLTFGAAPADHVCKFPHFHFNDEAQGVFIEWSEDMHKERIPKENDPIIRQHLSKYDKLFPALALLFHMVDCVARGVGGPVTREAALRAAAWCEYLEGHARRCYGLLKDDGLRAAQALAEKLEHGAVQDGFTARDVRRNQWRNLTTDDAVQAALDWLEDEGWIRGASTGGTGPGTGRRTTRYQIHPDLLRDAGKAAA